MKVSRGDELYELGNMIVYFLELLAWYKIRVSKFRGEGITVGLTSQKFSEEIELRPVTKE